MFCKHCGEKIEDGAINCTKCGKPTKKIDISKFNKILDFIKSKKIPFACIGVILIIGIIIISATTKYTTIDMKDLYTIQFTGLNENGKATVIFNDSALYEPTQKLFEKGDYLGQSALAELSELEYTISPNENLSNGDEITFKVYFPEEYYKNYNIKAKNLEQKIKVADLIIPEEIDVFEGLKLEFSGRSPFITCKIIKDNCNEFAQNHVRFEIDEIEEYFAIGEKILITAKCSESTLEEEKVKLTKNEAEFKVTGNEYYIDSMNGIDTTELLNDMRAQLELEYKTADDLFCGVELGWTNHFTDLKSEEKNGTLFLTLDDFSAFTEGSSAYNIYALCYKTKIGVEHRSRGNESTFESDMEVIVLAKNLYVDENNVLHYDDKIEVIAVNTEETPNYKSNYIKEQQDIYSVQELSTN